MELSSHPPKDGTSGTSRGAQVTPFGCSKDFLPPDRKQGTFLALLPGAPHLFGFNNHLRGLGGCRCGLADSLDEGQADLRQLRDPARTTRSGWHWLCRSCVCLFKASSKGSFTRSWPELQALGEAHGQQLAAVYHLRPEPPANH